LLTHTAGFSYPFSSAEYAAYIAALPAPPVMGTRAALNMPLLFEPGERWEYGFNTDWVGLAVEAASGETLDAFFQRHIFGPLGMEDTVFLPDEGQQGRRAAIHQRQEDGSLAASPPKPPQRPEIFSGGGGLFSTLNDYQKFLRMFLASGAGIISPETVAEMSRNQIGGLRAGYLASVDPAFTNSVDVAPGIDAKWGLGFLIQPVPGPLGRHAGSLSWAGAANTYFWIDPAADLAAVILMQILPAGDAGAVKTFGWFEKAVYAAPQ
jgi:methyl acetate hydrolase